MDKILKEIPNEIILLSYFQAYEQEYLCNKNDAPTLCFLQNKIPNLFEYILDVNKQFQVHYTLRNLENEKRTKKSELLLSQQGNMDEKLAKLDEIDKDYEFMHARFQKLWNFITNFNNNLKENSSESKLERLKSGKPIIIKTYSGNHIFAAKDLVFAIENKPFGEIEHIVYTKNDKQTYDELFGKANTISETKN